LRIAPNLQTSSKLNPLSTIVRYEVRVASTPADEIEVLRRQMMREFYHEKLAAAEAAGVALLEEVSPERTAYRIKGLLAKSSGDRKGAVDALSKARQLIAEGRDELWLAQTSNNARRALSDLTAEIDATSNNTPIKVH
jgi:hypothetical protein